MVRSADDRGLVDAIGVLSVICDNPGAELCPFSTENEETFLFFLFVETAVF